MEIVPSAIEGVSRAWVLMADVRLEAKCDGIAIKECGDVLDHRARGVRGVEVWGILLGLQPHPGQEDKAR